MKKKQGTLTGIAVLVAAVLFGFTACGNFFDNNDDNGSNGSQTGDVDYTSHNTDYSIMVRNNTGFALVAFKGDLQSDKIIGGIPAHAQNHGLPMDPALFDKTEDFPMILLTGAQYEANKNNLQSLKNAPFTRVYVFYNKNGDNSVNYEIAGGLGGNNTLTITNPSQTLNIELRLGGTAGETIGYAQAGMLETTLNLEDGNYNIFPVFKRYNRARDVVDTVYPKAQNGEPWFRAVSFGGIHEFNFNMRELLSGLTMTSGAAWIYINNQTQDGVRFNAGGSVRKTPSGLEYVMSMEQITFQIDMPRLSTNNYQNSITVSNWRFGPAGYEVPLQAGASDASTTITIERDKMYTVTVTGSHNNSDLKAYISSVTNIDVSDFNINN
jgi:hypothetical protein